MNARHQIYLVLFILALSGALYIRSQNSCSVPQQSPPPVPQPIVRSVPPDKESLERNPASTLLGDRALENYAREKGKGESDLRILHEFVSNALLLSKQADPRHYATNEDLAQLLLGNKGNRDPLLSPDHHALNDTAQIIDRWGSAIVVHIPRAGYIELRSPGPDKTPYSDDDLTWPASRTLKARQDTDTRSSSSPNTK